MSGNMLKTCERSKHVTFLPAFSIYLMKIGSWVSKDPHREECLMRKRLHKEFTQLKILHPILFVCFVLNCCRVCGDQCHFLGICGPSGFIPSAFQGALHSPRTMLSIRGESSGLSEGTRAHPPSCTLHVRSRGARGALRPGCPSQQPRDAAGHRRDTVSGRGSCRACPPSPPHAPGSLTWEGGGAGW